MDEGIGLPGTRFRIGLDPIIGLLPGLGDAAGAALSIWILVVAVRRGASRVTLVRIATTIALDALLGAIPLVGDVFDFAWKANLRSVALLERHLSDPVEARRADGLFLTLLLGALLLLCAGLIAGGALLTVWIVRAAIAR
jgi:hypothetical protein